MKSPPHGVYPPEPEGTLRGRLGAILVKRNWHHLRALQLRTFLLGKRFVTFSLGIRLGQNLGQGLTQTVTHTPIGHNGADRTGRLFIGIELYIMN